MNGHKFFITFVLCIFVFFLSCGDIFADDSGQFITVINPVRISWYSTNPSESLKTEYSVIRKNNISATWLLTYDSMQNNSVLSIIKKMDKGQEFGIFLEVTPDFAKDSGITYHNTGSWHHATSVFLSGYTQDERKILIDKVFQVFKEKFGQYPTSVGSWWTDSYSLSYMKERYGIVANLTCSDQLSTDGYQIWGQPWVLPYIPSKFHTAVPASNNEKKLGVVNLQWAPRDPLNGYDSSLYSTQDYMVAPKRQDIFFFRKLVELYTSYGQVTVGLESDLSPDVYKNEYAKQMDVVTEMKLKGIKIVTMSDYAKWYLQKYQNISPPTLIESKDLLGMDTKSFWYSGPNYRLFYINDGEKLEIKDLRIYNSNLQEPYYVSPNSSFNLTINIPYVISVSENPNDTWVLSKEAKITTSEDSIEIVGSGVEVPDKVENSKLLKIEVLNNKIIITFPKQDISKDGIVTHDFSVEAIHFFKQKKSILQLFIGKGWNYFKKVDYLIPQSEIYALLYLKSLPAGKVLVYDNECLQCTYHTQLPPPSFSNRRSYVAKESGHSIIYNFSVFKAKDRETVKNDLKKLGVKYVYLVKFEDYKEELPFSPGDLGVERIFSNANAEIWRVK